MTYPIKAHTLPLLEKILGTEDLDKKVKAFVDSRGGQTNDFHDYLESISFDTPLYKHIHGILKAGESSENPAFTDVALRYAAEYSMKYLVNHSEQGKESEVPVSAETMYEYVMRRLVKNGYIPADQPASSSN